jgi:hypothetical protein
VGVRLGEAKRHGEQIRRSIVFLHRWVVDSLNGGTSENVEAVVFLDVPFQNLLGRTGVNQGRRLSE